MENYHKPKGELAQKNSRTFTNPMIVLSGQSLDQTLGHIIPVNDNEGGHADNGGNPDKSETTMATSKD